MEVWSWSVFFRYLVNAGILAGVWTTIWLTFVTLGLAIVVGTLAALLARIPNRAVQWIYAGYVALFRATPLLVQLVFLYSALPQMGIRLSVIEAAILGLAISESSYVAEIVRSSISAIHAGQWEAARALGMTPATILRVVALPQATRIAIPPLGNEFVRQLKNTSLVSVISMRELFRATDNLIQLSFRVLEALTVATIYYLVITAIWTLIQNAIEQRLSVWVADQPRRRRLLPADV